MTDIVDRLRDPRNHDPSDRFEGADVIDRLRADNRRLRDEALVFEHGWQPIATVPEDDLVLIGRWCRGSSMGDYWKYQLGKGSEWLKDSYSHWMPLPEAPEGP